MNVVIVGNARCFHTMDWYREVKSIISPREVIFLTDLIDSESHEKLVIPSDRIENLYNIDHLLFRKQTMSGNVWRNIVKALFIPLQVIKLRAYRKRNPNVVFHAITIYYMLVCWLANIPFIGTPQGSEILERPDFSKVYNFFAIKSLLAARYITVDSVSMKNKIYDMCMADSNVIQNGINVSEIESVEVDSERNNLVSIRGMYPLYRLDYIMRAREAASLSIPIQFFYPYWDDIYKEQMLAMFKEGDKDIGRLPKPEMYKLLKSSFLAISIPLSDSSPRSVYEAIFCGCCVAVTPNLFIESMPACMKERLFIVDLEDNLWLAKAIEFAKVVVAKAYQPSEEALNLFDQKRSMKLVCDNYYDPGKWTTDLAYH